MSLGSPPIIAIEKSCPYNTNLLFALNDPGYRNPPGVVIVSFFFVIFEIGLCDVQLGQRLFFVVVVLGIEPRDAQPKPHPSPPPFFFLISRQGLTKLHKTLLSCWGLASNLGFSHLNLPNSLGLQVCTTTPSWALTIDSDTRCFFVTFYKDFFFPLFLERNLIHT